MNRLVSIAIVLSIVVSLCGICLAGIYLVETQEDPSYTLHVKGDYEIQVFENSNRVVIITDQESIKED